jgi:hypothetical protein
MSSISFILDTFIRQIFIESTLSLIPPVLRKREAIASVSYSDQSKATTNHAGGR